MANAAVAELRHSGLAERDGAGGTHPLDDDVVLVRHEVGIGNRARHGEHVLGADQILDPVRHPGERTYSLTRGDRSVHRFGFAQRKLRRRRAEGV